ncbi:Hypothetical predicted protein [Paramuricea clavata]|uniref:Reverse transcriptase domain-containing protein n=1 Tax=Paramuricea clavata TaxID=317549 RepID=A0A6S7IAF4_PARCT|nr:Hypothetical predicted protein [Paramuricea clavata]
MEKIIRDRSIEFWLRYKVFNQNQFGYLRNKSTLSQLLLCYNDWAQARNAKITTDVFFFRFPKSVRHIVPYEPVLHKLEQYGISGVLLNWFRNFLTNRSQCVVVRGSFSTWTKVTSGVPQGTSLGPILILTYINDFRNGISSPTKLFADDTKVYRGLIDLEKDKQILQSDLDRMT